VVLPLQAASQCRLGHARLSICLFNLPFGDWLSFRSALMLSVALLHVFWVVLPLQAASHCQRRLGNACHTIHLFKLAFCDFFCAARSLHCPIDRLASKNVLSLLWLI
jgi:hypothetical protein